LIRYVYHPGSGTYFTVEEAVLLEVTEEVDEAINRGDVTLHDCEAREADLADVVECFLEDGWPEEE